VSLGQNSPNFGLVPGIRFPDINGVSHEARWASFVERMKASGSDLRITPSSYSPSGLFVSNANEVAKIKVVVDSEIATGIAASFLSHAMNRGYRQYCANNGSSDNLYMSFLFIWHMIVKCMQGNQADIPKVEFPDFLLEILAALQPKDGAQVGSGVVGYSWKISNPNSVPGPFFKYPNIQSSVGGTFFLGSATSSLTQGYNVMAATTTAYSDELGKSAFQDLINFMSDRTLSKDGRYQPLRSRTYDLNGTYLEKSVSAFASVNKVIGDGVKGGFAYSLAALETTIKHPKFCCFADPTINLNRGFNKYHSSGGDSNYLVMSLLTQMRADEVTNPNHPIFKPIDFYEFADRFARYITICFQKYTDDNSVNKRYPNIGLTAEDFLIALRKILMTNFSETQYGVQSLRFYGGTSQDEFYPFMCGAGCGSSGRLATLILPLYMVENMNSLRARQVYPNINPKTRKTVLKNPRVYVPVLGKYQKSIFQQEIYNYQVGEDNISIFLPGQILVNLVDGNVNNVFLDIDLSEKVSNSIEQLNDILNVFGMYTQQPTAFTGDSGVNVLTVIGDTYFVRDKNETYKDKSDKSQKGKKVVLIEKDVIGRMSQQIPFQDLSAIKKPFVTPEYRLNTLLTDVGSIDVNTMKILNYEMWFEGLGQKYGGTEEGSYPNMIQLRREWTSHCVKDKLGKNTMIVDQLVKLTEAGNAGLLGSLVSVFGGELAKTAVGALGGFIPY